MSSLFTPHSNTCGIINCIISSLKILLARSVGVFASHGRLGRGRNDGDESSSSAKELFALCAHLSSGRLIANFTERRFDSYHLVLGERRQFFKKRAGKKNACNAASESQKHNSLLCGDVALLINSSRETTSLPPLVKQNKKKKGGGACLLINNNAPETSTAHRHL